MYLVVDLFIFNMEQAPFFLSNSKNGVTICDKYFPQHYQKEHLCIVIGGWILIFKFIADLTPVEKKCVLYHVHGWNYIADIIIWRPETGQHGLHWFMEDCSCQKLALYWHAQSWENSKVFDTSALSFCQVRTELLNDEIEWCFAVLKHTTLLSISNFSCNNGHASHEYWKGTLVQGSML